MKKKIFSLFMVFCLCLSPQRAKADIWGADVAVLLEILANALQQAGTIESAFEKRR